MSMTLVDQELESKGTNNRSGAQCSEVTVVSQQANFLKQTPFIPTNASATVA